MVKQKTPVSLRPQNNPQAQEGSETAAAQRQLRGNIDTNNVAQSSTGERKTAHGDIRL
jgi:hypothetical protein